MIISPFADVGHMSHVHEHEHILYRIYTHIFYDKVQSALLTNGATRTESRQFQVLTYKIPNFIIIIIHHYY